MEIFNHISYITYSYFHSILIIVYIFTIHKTIYKRIYINSLKA